LIAERTQALLRASGAAVALSDEVPDSMVCRASSGDQAPPVGARLQVGSGFSGECVKSGMMLRCDDSDLDARVDRESCRALGIRSIVAVPIRADGKSVGLIEAFSGQANSFSQADGRVLQKIADLVLAAVNRAAVAENLPSLGKPGEPQFEPPQGSVLFATADEEESKKPKPEDESSGGFTLPRSHLIILGVLAALISTALGYQLAPWIRSDAAPWIQQKLHMRERAQLATVLASTQPPKSDNPVASSTGVETATFDQLKQMAEKGDAAAENALGLRYARGEGVEPNEGEAVRWFIKAAEQGNVLSQSKLGTFYFSGRGVPKDANRAYFWIVLARLSGDHTSKTLAPFVRAQLSRAQAESIELEADRWLQQHRTDKPPAGQLKASY
jgi:hypothetical protein